MENLIFYSPDIDTSKQIIDFEIFNLTADELQQIIFGYQNLIYDFNKFINNQEKTDEFYNDILKAFSVYPVYKVIKSDLCQVNISKFKKEYLKLLQIFKDGKIFITCQKDDGCSIRSCDILHYIFKLHQNLKIHTKRIERRNKTFNELITILEKITFKYMV